MSVKLQFERGDLGSFEGEVRDDAIARTRHGVIVEAEREGEDGRPEPFAAKRAMPGHEWLIELERATAEALDHPGVVRYLGAARAPETGRVLAFERLGRNPLLLMNAARKRPRFRDPRTAYAPLPPPRAIELGFDVLRALEHVHARGFVHGSIDLTSVLVRAPGAARDAGALLQDIGEGAFEGVLAGLATARSTAFLERLARGEEDPDHAPVPPALYAAPEMLFERGELGGRKIFSPAGDLYGFGLVLYALVTGRMPYDHVCEPAELVNDEVIAELKVRETRGEIFPFAAAALDAVPMHDVAFDAPRAHAWPRFRSAIGWLIARSSSPDPARRPTSAEARAFMEKKLALRAVENGGARRVVQRLFQIRPFVNRLSGDATAGISVREVEGQVLVEERRAPPSSPKPAEDEAIPAGEGTIVTFRTEDHGAKTIAKSVKRGAPTAPRGAVYLAEVLRELNAGRPLPVTAPVLLTSTSFGPRDLARCLIYSLGRAPVRVRIREGTAEERVVVVAGRAEDSDLVIADAAVSKRHAAFERKGGAWWVEDLKSSNGTFLDDVGLAKGGRELIKGTLATITLGPTSKLAFMEESELKAYLARALEAFVRAFGKTGTRRVARPEEDVIKMARPGAPSSPAPSGAIEDGFLDEAPPLDLHAPTKKVTRELVKDLRGEMAKLVARGRPLPENLEGRLVAQTAPSSRIRIVLEGARIEMFSTAPEAIELLKSSANEIESVEIIPQLGGPVILFRRTPADE